LIGDKLGVAYCTLWAVRHYAYLHQFSEFSDAILPANSANVSAPEVIYQQLGYILLFFSWVEKLF